MSNCITIIAEDGVSSIRSEGIILWDLIFKMPLGSGLLNASSILRFEFCGHGACWEICLGYGWCSFLAWELSEF